MTSVGKDSLKTQRTLAVGNRNYEYFSLHAATQRLGDISLLPISLKILLENILRLEDGRAYTVEHAQAIADWPKKRTSTQEVAFSPVRILMQDFTGVPAIIELAAMRDGIDRLGGKPERILKLHFFSRVLRLLRVRGPDNFRALLLFTTRKRNGQQDYGSRRR